MSDRERATCRKIGLVPADYPDPIAADWPDLLEIVEQSVKPERDSQKRDALRERWWQYAEKRPGLRNALEQVKHVYTTLSQASAYHSVARVPVGAVFSSNLNIICCENEAMFASLQCRAHEHWMSNFGSTMKDDPVYTIKGCFEPFPFVKRDQETSRVVSAANEYRVHRTNMMVDGNEGLTETFNRFHDHDDTGTDIVRLRELHHQLDQAVLGAYGWQDLAEAANPEFLTEENEPDHRYQGRLFWPAPFRDEVLARLLDLNATRVAAERARGLVPTAVYEMEDA